MTEYESRIIDELQLQGAAVQEGPSGSLSICLFGTDFGDESLSLVAKLSHVELLDIAATKITPAGLKRGCELGDLRTLRINESQATVEGIGHINAMTNPPEVFVSGRKIEFAASLASQSRNDEQAVEAVGDQIGTATTRLNSEPPPLPESVPPPVSRLDNIVSHEKLVAQGPFACRAPECKQPINRGDEYWKFRFSETANPHIRRQSLGRGMCESYFCDKCGSEIFSASNAETQAKAAGESEYQGRPTMPQGPPPMPRSEERTQANRAQRFPNPHNRASNNALSVGLPFTCPAWCQTGGIVATVVAGLGFLASASVAGGKTLEGSIIAGLLNPLFFIGAPLAAYWLWQVKRANDGNEFYCPHCRALGKSHLQAGATVHCPNCLTDFTKPGTRPRTHGWSSSNRLMRGATNRANERLAAEIGSYGFGTATLALALGHACYPDATYGDSGTQDFIVQHLKQLKASPCDCSLACKQVESWLDKGELSTHQVFMNVWGMDPDELLQRFFAESGIRDDAG